MIACGDTGIKIGSIIIDLLKKYGTTIQSLMIPGGEQDRETNKKFSYTFSISSRDIGFARDLNLAMKEIAEDREELTKQLQLITPERVIPFIFVSAGATSIASALLILEILKANYNIYPPVFILMPDTFENSRVHYNVAQFLFKVNYSSDPLGNSIILLDNKPTVEEENKQFEDIARKKIDLVGMAIGNLIFSSLLEQTSNEFTASFSDLMDTLQQGGIGVIVNENLLSDKSTLNTRFNDILSDNVSNSTGLTNEEIFESNKTFCLITKVNTSGVQFQVEIKKLTIAFDKNLLFLKVFDETSQRDWDISPQLNAIVGDLPLPPRVIQIMETARDSRKRILLEEEDIANETVNINVSEINKLENQIESYYKK